jgi:flagellar protein FlbD
MIELTRLNGHRLTINSDLIRYVEATPDTTITLVTGEKLIVLETPSEITERIVELRALTLRGAWPSAISALTARAGHNAAHAEHEPFFERTHR